jgi:senataxin
VQLCFKLLELLELSWIKGERPRVAVITPYAFQCHRIKQYTKPLAAQIDLTISTVDGFQGRESDVVILSCVRNAKFGMGFMLDTRRMNVALTRAKFGLWVLCSSQNAMLSPLWQALFTDASARSRIVSEKQTNNLIKFGTQR